MIATATTHESESLEDNKLMAPGLYHITPKAIVAYAKAETFGHMSIGTLITAGIMSATSLLLATVPDPTPLFGPEEKLIAVCLSGGIAGGLVAIIMFPLTRIKQTALKWLASSVAAGTFSPAICKNYNLQTDISECLFLSGMVGLTAWAILLATIPLVSNIAKWFVRKWFPDAFATEERGGLSRSRPDWIEPPLTSDKDTNDEFERRRRM